MAPGLHQCAAQRNVIFSPQKRAVASDASETVVSALRAEVGALKLELAAARRLREMEERNRREATRDVAALKAALTLVERFDLEPYSDFSAK